MDVRQIFGEINPSNSEGGLTFLRFGSGSAGISNFLSAIVNLLYIFAAVIFVFMLLWGALEWLLSGGDKEKVASAQRRLTNAFIGIIILAVTFALLNIVGTFTGFTFFR